MTQALITVNAVAGSNTDLPINTLVQLNNTNNGGEVTYAWSILDQPPGTTDTLSSAVAQNPTFTPKKEGSYLVQVIVNQSLADEQTNRVVCAVRQLKTRTRVPAAGETTEADASEGYAGHANGLFRLVDTARADPGIIVAQLASNRSANDVVHFTSTAVIKSGLPGQESVPVVDVALATQAYILTEELGILVGAVDGGALNTGKLAYVRVFGMQKTVTVASMVAGDTLYVSDTGVLSRTVGTNTRRVGKAMANTPGDVYFKG